MRAEKTEATRQRPAGATSTGDGEPLPGAVKTRGDATEAGGGNLHRGRGPTAWGIENCRFEVQDVLETITLLMSTSSRFDPTIDVSLLHHAVYACLDIFEVILKSALAAGMV